MTLNRVVRGTHEKVYSGTKTGEMVSDVSFHCQAGRLIGRASEANITAISCHRETATLLATGLRYLMLPNPGSGKRDSFDFLATFQGKRRADERTRTANLPITSDNRSAAEICTGLQNPHT
jgi:hypothetical protein